MTSVIMRSSISASVVATVQGGFYVLNGLWPVAHMRSFTAVTGPKTDLWLVQAFGMLIAAIGAVLLLVGVRRKVDVPTLLFGIATALTLAFIDVWFFLRGAISAVYLADAAAELVLALSWGWVWRRSPR